MSRLCVIGAGAAGLSALQQLRAAGHDVECFEQTERVGGHWHTDYDALHLITSRDQTAFEGFPMPAAYPHFPRRDEVRDYIEAYAAHHDLHAAIRFGAAVVSVTPEPGEGAPGAAGWRVATSDGDEGVFDGVLVANGHLWSPRVPAAAGRFDGPQVHSGAFRNPGALDGERVLVVGAGNSGCDIAVDLAQHRREVDVVVRRGVHFQPKRYMGRPRAELPFLADFRPEEQDLLNRLLARLVIGRNTDYPGLPAPEAETLADGPVTVNDLLLHWIHHGRIGIRPAIERLDGHVVHFADGTHATYDAIVWATGFEVRLPFLDDGLLGWEAGVPRRYAGGILPEGAERLFLVGLISPRGPQIPVYGEQAKLIARMVDLHAAGRTDLAAHFARLQAPETRIDVVRAAWNAQMADTARLLDALAVAGAPA